MLARFYLAPKGGSGLGPKGNELAGTCLQAIRLNLVKAVAEDGRGRGPPPETAKVDGKGGSLYLIETLFVLGRYNSRGG